MNAVRRIVEKFGGQGAMAKLIGKNKSTIQCWEKAGSIPSKWQAAATRLKDNQKFKKKSYL